MSVLVTGVSGALAGIGRPGLTSMSKTSPATRRPFTSRSPAIWQISSPWSGRSPVVSLSKTT